MGTELLEKSMELVSNENVQNKASELLGMIFPFMGMDKKSVDKALDLYIKNIEESKLSTETKIIALINAKKYLKGLRNQYSIVEIARNNVKKNTDLSSKSKVGEEWLDRFMESAAFVSSGEMQLVWGKILASEFETPGSTPPNMTRILSEFTPTYANAFRTICSMKILLVTINEQGTVEKASWKIAVPYEGNEEYMQKKGLTFETFNELENLGVIKFDPLAGYAATEMQDMHVLVCVDGEVVNTIYRPDEDFPIGNVILTSSGEALRKITDTYKLDGYMEVVKSYMVNNSVSFGEDVEYDVEVSEMGVRVRKRKYYPRTEDGNR